MAHTNLIIVDGTVIELTVEQMKTVLTVVRSMSAQTVAQTTPTPTAPTQPKKSTKKAKTFAPATDFTVPYEVRKADKGYVLGFTDRVPRDAYTVIANAMGETKWDKELKGFAFKTKKSADDFAKTHAVIASADREAVRATWHKEV